MPSWGGGDWHHWRRRRGGESGGGPPPPPSSWGVIPVMGSFDWSPTQALALQTIKLKPKLSINTAPLATRHVYSESSDNQQCSHTQRCMLLHCLSVSGLWPFFLLWLLGMVCVAPLSWSSLLGGCSRGCCQPASSHGGCSVPAACSSSSRLKHRPRSLSCGVCGQLCVEPAGSPPPPKIQRPLADAPEAVRNA